MFKQAPALSTSFTVTEDGFPVGNRPQYSDAEREFTKVLIPSGGVPVNPSDNLAVTAAGGMDVSVAKGVIIKNGMRGYLDTAKTISIATSASDQVIYIGIRMAAGDTHVDGDDVLAYTTFVQATDWSVARINIPANATTITAGMITNLRGNPAYCPFANDLITQAEAALAAIAENGVPTHAATHAAAGDDPIDIDACNGVQYVAQTLTSGEKSQVRTNIGAAETAVDNLSSTSTTAALAANQGKILNNSKMSSRVLLWTNPSPNSSFAAQTISLSLTGYDAVIIDCAAVAMPDAIGSTNHLCLVGEANVIRIPHYRNQIRNVSVSTSGVTFATGQVYATYNNSTLTDTTAANIPMRIFGVEHLVYDA